MVGHDFTISQTKLLTANVLGIAFYNCRLIT